MLLNKTKFGLILEPYLRVSNRLISQQESKIGLGCVRRYNYSVGKFKSNIYCLPEIDQKCG